VIDFVEAGDRLLLSYAPEVNVEGVESRLISEDGLRIRRTFYFRASDLDDASTDHSSGTYSFVLGAKDKSNKYWQIEGRFLASDHDLYWPTTLSPRIKHFVAVRDISIWGRLLKMAQKDIRIGDFEDSDLSLRTFRNLLKHFPKSTELDKYAAMRISSVVREELELPADHAQLYEEYRSRTPKITLADDFLQVRVSEHWKYLYLHARLTQMLHNSNNYSEKDWQREIVPVLEVIFPKYVAVLSEVTFRDVVAQKNRRLDFAMVDCQGNLDLIEIKKPEDKPILTNNQYRDNHVPLRDLAGAIMQVEKYIYLLNKWGQYGEKKLTDKYRSRLPESVAIQFTNPHGVILMGLDRMLTSQQRLDFEVISRQYKNIVEIITYDDLLRRLKLLADKFAPSGGATP
jgi:hypothetical protein